MRLAHKKWFKLGILFLFTFILNHIVWAQSNPLSSILPKQSYPDSNQSNKDQTEDAEKLRDPGIKNVYDFATQILEFAEDSLDQIGLLGPSTQLNEKLNLLNLKVRQKLLEAGRLGVIGIHTSSKIDELKSALSEIKSDLRMLEEELASKITAGDQLQKTWSARKQEWQQKIRSLPENEAKRAAQELFTDVEKSFEQVSASIDSNLAKIIEAKQQLDATKEQYEILKETIDFQWDKFRNSFWQNNAPNIFAAKLAISSKDLERWFDKITKRPMFDLKLWNSYKLYFLLQILLFALAYSLLSGQKEKIADFELKYSLAKLSPFLLFVFFFTIPNLVFLKNSPPDAFLALCSFFSLLSLWKVAGHVLENRAWNIAFKFSITLFFLLKFMQYLELPASFSRLYLILVSASILFYFGIQFRNFQAKDFQYRFLVICCTLFGFFVFLSQILGYVNLSLHVFESLCISVSLAFLIVMLSKIARDIVKPVIELFLAPRSKMVEAYKANFLGATEKIIMIVSTVFVFLMLFRIWDITNEPQSVVESLFDFGFEIGGTRYTFGLFFLAILVFYIFYKASQFSQVFLSQEIYPRRGMEKGTGVAINRLIHYFIVMVAFLVSCSIVGFELKNIAFIGGAIGIGIGFGLQTIINNFVSGLILLLERSIKVGDTVIIDDTWGTIVKIGLRATVMETLEKSEITVPNSRLVTESVTNWTLSNRAARFEIEVGVAYGSDVDKVKKLLLDVVEKHRRIKKLPKPQALFHAFGDSALIFRVRGWIYNIDEIFEVKSDVHFAIEEVFNKNGIQIPFPQRDVHLHSVTKTNTKKKTS